MNKDRLLGGLAVFIAFLALGACTGTQRPATEANAALTMGQQLEGLLFWSQAEREARFPRMQEIFPAHRVAAGGTVRVLPMGAPLRPEWEDDTTVDAYLDVNHLAGVMVLQDGAVRLERYAAGHGPQTRWTSFSVAKSVTSLLLGVALKRGEIASLDDRLDLYINELHDFPYGEVTVRELLTMTSGIRWNEDYEDAQSDVARMYMAPCIDGEAHILSYMKALPREWPAGTHWNYSTGETDLLGILVQRATGQTLADYLSATLWQPGGMAADAWWLADECDGSNIGGSGLSATLGDYARIGQFMLEGARIGGEPVPAAEWLRDATRLLQPVDQAGTRGYGYLWWIDPDGSYAALGIFGQLVFVDPVRRLVIAQFGTWPQADGRALVAGRRAFVAAVQRAVDAEAAGAGEKHPGE